MAEQRGRMRAALPIILVVDDEESILRLLARLLHPIGVIHTASSGEQGLLFLQSEPVDLVLSDQTMPGMTGDRLLAEVSCRWPGTERILMSSHCDPDVVAQGLHTGEIGHFVRKPLDPTALQEIQQRANSAHSRRVTHANATP